MILKVEKDQNPYYVIERYIYEHSEVVEDMIAVLEIDGVRTNELLEVDSCFDGWTWLNDWWEGEPEIALVDFYPVRLACNPKTSIPLEWICKEWLSNYRDMPESAKIVISELVKKWRLENANPD